MEVKLEGSYSKPFVSADYMLKIAWLFCGFFMEVKVNRQSDFEGSSFP